jgi:hypothetical protein
MRTQPLALPSGPAVQLQVSRVQLQGCSGTAPRVQQYSSTVFRSTASKVAAVQLLSYSSTCPRFQQHNSKASALQVQGSSSTGFKVQQYSLRFQQYSLKVSATQLPRFPDGAAVQLAKVTNIMPSWHDAVLYEPSRTCNQQITCCAKYNISNYAKHTYSRTCQLPAGLLTAPTLSCPAMRSQGQSRQPLQQHLTQKPASGGVQL